MADLWLEKELSRQLAPVAAPESLWDRINQHQRKPVHRVSFDWAFWPVAAAMGLLALAGVVHIFGVGHDPDGLAEQELALVTSSTQGRTEFKSFNEIRAWAKAEANIDIDVPPGSRAADRITAQMLGARLIRLRGLPIAAIDYRVGDQVATLFVSGKRAGLSGNTESSKHLFSQMKSRREDARLFSWNMGDETYTIAFSGAKSSHGVCLLCHAGMPGSSTDTEP